MGNSSGDETGKAVKVEAHEHTGDFGTVKAQFRLALL
jgi:hypothetical protein